MKKRAVVSRLAMTDEAYMTALADCVERLARAFDPSKPHDGGLSHFAQDAWSFALDLSGFREEISA